MPCGTENPQPVLADTIIQDWASIHPYIPTGVYDPASREELVRAILDGEKAGGGLRAQGACYSLSKAQVADHFLIRTGKLNKHLCNPFAEGPVEFLPKDRLRKGHENDSLKLRHGVSPANGNFFVYVEAGVKIKQLLVDLAGVGLALPTMGSGGDQTLAGALSTGTHNSDVVLPPLVDFVRAVHLVGPGGQEWWIEPSQGFAARPELTQLTNWCKETYVVRDDDFFRAALVTVGRLGVVYAYVLEVPPPYWLLEQTEKATWSGVRERLRKSAEDGADYFGNGGMFAGADLRFCQLAVDLSGRDVCWVKRRFLWRGEHKEDLPGEGAGDFLASYCKRTSEFIPAIQALDPVFLALEGQILAVPFVGIAWAARLEALRFQLQDWAKGSTTVGNLLTKVVKEINGLTEGEVGFVAPELKAILRQTINDLFDGEFIARRVGPSFKIIDTHTYARDGCLSGNSTEMFFDASKNTYLKFMDEVRSEAQKNGFLPGYVSLRFTRGSRALLAPEQFPISVAIEVAVPRSTDEGDAYPEFFSAVLDIARQHEGIPHWGQQLRLKEPRLKKLYGDKLETWRWALSETEADRPKSFSSHFSRDCGLEDGGKSIDSYRAQRSGGVLASCLPLLFP